MKMPRPEVSLKAAIAVLVLLALGAALVFERSATSPAQTRMAVCAICGPRDNSGPEVVRATTQRDGKTYAFCGFGCKDEFEQNPEPFLSPQ